MMSAFECLRQGGWVISGALKKQGSLDAHCTETPVSAEKPAQRMM